jgi:hypothetical protein
METLDLTDFGHKFVIHYGGRLNEVNANTFANSLIYLSNVIDTINQEVNPGFSIEIIIEAIGPGSFRPKLKIAGVRLKDVFKGFIKKDQIVIILIMLFTLWKSGGPNNITTTLKKEQAIIETKTKKIILPKTIYEITTHVYGNISIQKNITNNFTLLDEDPSITDFGITKDLGDEDLVFKADKKDFPFLAEKQIIEDTESSRRVEEKAVIQVIKSILERKKRKWEFVWKGFRITAIIEDDNFFEALEDGLKFGIGDNIEVTLEIKQSYDKNAGVWINESYIIKKYHKYIPAPRQTKMLE